MPFKSIYYIPSKRNFVLNFLVKSQLEKYQNWLDSYCCTLPYKLVYAKQIKNEGTAKFIAFDPLSTKRVERIVNLFSVHKALNLIVSDLYSNRGGLKHYLWKQLEDTLPLSYYEGLKKFRCFYYDDGNRFSIDTSNSQPTPKKTPQRNQEKPVDLEKQKFIDLQKSLPYKSECDLSEKQIKAMVDIIRNQIEIRLKMNGISALDDILNQEFLVSLPFQNPDGKSKIVIDSNGNIILEDWKIIVNMPTLSKVVYILFLYHPEGIVLKEINNYRSEIENIYKKITKRLEVHMIQKSIDELCDPTSNSINEKLSRIKTAFSRYLPKTTATPYLPIGERGLIKKIHIDSSLIHLEKFK